MIVARNSEEAEAAVNEKTAMMFGGSDYIIAVGNKYNIPILVDRAALGVTKPIEDLERGADLVAVSGGKIMRGPQPTGILFGRKDLVTAAFLNMYPHHSFGRICKLGKEEIMGCLAAVDLYINGTDQEALRLEWKIYRSDGNLAKQGGYEEEIKPCSSKMLGTINISDKNLSDKKLSNYVIFYVLKYENLEGRWVEV